ncbi:ABC transporter substrate-binding protein [Nesterenkonia alba]|uniref:ABC transporter substrate-binding protein n=1 Tax=Nesterenkonia alba TaxID=515814 RepID=UPI0003B438E8|nr:ABC transporter substrate-binding protein [Nesterenkonia alba]
MSEKHTPLWRLLALGMAGTLALSACGNGDDGGNGSADGGEDIDEAEAEVDGRDNDLVIGVPLDVQDWDPIATFALAWSTQATSVFEGLVHRDLDLELQPGLAEDWEYHDDTTLEFQLREGVEFHNGEPFNADAVAYTFDRLLGEEGAQGPQQENYTAIEEVEVVDDYTVIFHLNTPDPVLLTNLSGYGGVIVPPEYMEEHGPEHFSENPVGTGPFEVTEYSRDNQTVLERNENYWDEDRIPELDTVTFRIIPEASTRLAELQTGGIDVMKEVEISQIGTVEDHDLLELDEVETPTVRALRFDVDREPVDDPRVREAINYAIDRNALIDDLRDGYGVPVASFQSELSFGFNPDLEPYPYDPDRARELIEEAGVEGEELDLYVPGDDGNAQEAVQAIAYFLEDVGLSVNIESAEQNTLNTELVPAGDAGHIHWFGWGGWTLDFHNTAWLLYSEGEFYNPSFADDQVQELLDAQRESVSEEEREEIFHELTEVLQELNPDAPLYADVYLYAINERVQNWQSPHDDRLQLEDVTVD